MVPIKLRIVKAIIITLSGVRSSLLLKKSQRRIELNESEQIKRITQNNETMLSW